MGQQQIIYLVLVVILVSIAIAIAITIFRDKELEGEMNNVAWQLMDSANKAFSFYKLPVSYGGAGQSFDLTLDNSANWMPELLYAVDVSVERNDSGSETLVFQASIPSGTRRATLVLETSGESNLTWEKIN